MATELLFGQPAIGMSDEMKLFGKTLVSDPGGDSTGAAFYGEGGDIEFIFYHPAPLGLSSITFLGATAIWKPLVKRWETPVGVEPWNRLIIIPQKRQETDGTIPILIDFTPVPDGYPKFGNFVAVDLVAAKNAGSINTNVATTWQYETDAETNTIVPAEFPAQFLGVKPFTFSTAGEAGPAAYIGDYRDGANDSWEFLKLGGIWAPRADYEFSGNATAKNAPNWRNGSEFYHTSSGHKFPGEPLDYTKDKIGSAFNPEQRPTLGYPQ